MAMQFRFSVCNEIFKDYSFVDGCRTIKRLGYEGIEIAPFTLAEVPGTISASDRRQYRQVMADEALEFVGLHWLMISPAGLHVTTPDLTVRAKSWEHIRHLIDLCADLGENGVLVFGSPKQRSTVGGMSSQEAKKVFTEELAKVAPLAEQRGVRILVEALPSNQSDVINTLQEAAGIVDQIGSPAVQTMFDTHNAADEVEPHTEIVKRYIQKIAHVHVNEMDGREPGMGDYDFAALLRTLSDVDYGGWVSLEAFDFSRDAEVIAGGSLRHLEKALESIQTSSTETKQTNSRI